MKPRGALTVLALAVISTLPARADNTGTGIAPPPQPTTSVVNVRDFGATGDGAADDTAAIQKALDTGRDVFLPRGKYRVTATLRLTSHSQQLSSERTFGAEAAWFHGTIVWDGPKGGVVLDASLGGACLIANLTLSGAGLKAGKGVLLNNGKAGTGVWSQRLENVQIRECDTGLDFGPGPFPAFAHDALLSRCEIMHCRIGVSNISASQAFLQCTIGFCTEVGYCGSAEGRATFLGGVFSSNELDVRLTNASFTAFGTWFENAKRGLFDRTSGGAIRTLVLDGCHLHAFCPTHLMDLSGCAGSLALVGNWVYPTTTCNLVKLSPDARDVALAGNNGLVVDDHHPLTPLNGWRADGKGAAYLRRNSMVYLQGFLTAGARAPGNVVCELPAGFRPEGRCCLTAAAFAHGDVPEVAIVSVEPTGEVKLVKSPAGLTGLDLSGVSYPAAQP